MKTMDLQKQREYEEYVDQCGIKSPLSFEQWEKYYDKGELFMLDEEAALRSFRREPNYEKH